MLSKSFNKSSDFQIELMDMMSQRGAGRLVSLKVMATILLSQTDPPGMEQPLNIVHRSIFVQLINCNLVDDEIVYEMDHI